MTPVIHRKLQPMAYLCDLMIARRKPKKGAVAARVKQMANDAAVKGEKRYQADLAEAQGREANAKKLQDIPSGKSHIRAYSENNRRAAVNAAPSKDIQTRKASGLYEGSVPVAGTSDKKLYAKRNPIKGVRRSDAKPGVKRAMIRKMRSGY